MLPHAPVSAVFAAADAGRLERELAGGALERRFEVSDTPHRALCSACPRRVGCARGRPELTRREPPGWLF
jgi:hypothetical protein